MSRIPKALAWALALAGASIGSVACWTLVSSHGDGGPARAPAATLGGRPTVRQLSELSSLTTLKVDVADAIVTEIRGYAGGVKAVLVVRGEVAIGVDLAAAEVEFSGDRARTVRVTLPEPSVQFARVDHERTSLLGVWNEGVWRVTPGGSAADAAVVNAVYRDAQRRVASAIGHDRLNDRARTQAERVLGAFFAALGWAVEVRWSGSDRR